MVTFKSDIETHKMKSSNLSLYVIQTIFVYSILISFKLRISWSPPPGLMYICISYCYTKNLLLIGYRKHNIDLKYVLMNEFSFIMACCACLDGLFSSGVEIQSMGKRPQNDS